LVFQAVCAVLLNTAIADGKGVSFTIEHRLQKMVKGGAQSH